MKTNFVRVTDVGAFSEWIGRLGGVVRERDGKVAVAFEGGEPSAIRSVDGETLTAYDSFREDVASWLVPGDVLVAMSLGSDAASIVNGYAWAINAEGDEAEVHLSDIYVQASRLTGPNADVEFVEN